MISPLLLITTAVLCTHPLCLFLSKTLFTITMLYYLANSMNNLVEGPFSTSSANSNQGDISLVAGKKGPVHNS